MTEQVADLGERNAALDQPGGVLVPQVVPVQGSARLSAPLCGSAWREADHQAGHWPPRRAVRCGGVPNRRLRPNPLDCARPSLTVHSLFLG